MVVKSSKGGSSGIFRYLRVSGAQAPRLTSTVLLCALALVPVAPLYPAAADEPGYGSGAGSTGGRAGSGPAGRVNPNGSVYAEPDGESSSAPSSTGGAIGTGNSKGSGGSPSLDDVPLDTGTPSLPNTSGGAASVAGLVERDPAHFSEQREKLRINRAVAHYSRSRALLLSALAEFDKGRKLADPSLLLDGDRWRDTVTEEARKLEKILAPQPREAEAGVLLEADTRLLGSDVNKP